jgi:replication factor C subunit 3/5
MGFICGLGAQQEIAQDMVKEQSPKALYGVRGKLYELLANCIPPELILRTLLLDLLKRLDDELKVETTALAALYEHRLQVGGGAVGRVRSGVKLEMRVCQRA